MNKFLKSLLLSSCLFNISNAAFQKEDAANNLTFTNEVTKEIQPKVCDFKGAINIIRSLPLESVEHIVSFLVKGNKIVDHTLETSTMLDIIKSDPELNVYELYYMRGINEPLNSITSNSRIPLNSYSFFKEICNHHNNINEIIKLLSFLSESLGNNDFAHISYYYSKNKDIPALLDKYGKQIFSFDKKRNPILTITKAQIDNKIKHYKSASISFKNAINYYNLQHSYSANIDNTILSIVYDRRNNNPSIKNLDIIENLKKLANRLDEVDHKVRTSGFHYYLIPTTGFMNPTASKVRDISIPLSGLTPNTIGKHINSLQVLPISCDILYPDVLMGWQQLIIELPNLRQIKMASCGKLPSNPGIVNIFLDTPQITDLEIELPTAYSINAIRQNNNIKNLSIKINYSYQLLEVKDSLAELLSSLLDSNFKETDNVGSPIIPANKSITTLEVIDSPKHSYNHYDPLANTSLFSDLNIRRIVRENNTLENMSLSYLDDFYGPAYLVDDINSNPNSKIKKFTFKFNSPQAEFFNPNMQEDTLENTPEDVKDSSVQIEFEESSTSLSREDLWAVKSFPESVDYNAEAYDLPEPDPISAHDSSDESEDSSFDENFDYDGLDLDTKANPEWTLSYIYHPSGATIGYELTRDFSLIKKK